MKDLVVGLANSVHDGAIAFCSDDGVFAEAFERHVQVKRALGCAGLFSSWRPLRAALRRVGVDTTALQRASVRTTWQLGEDDFDILRRTLSPAGSDDGYISMIAGGAAWDSTTAIQLGWILRGEFPHVHPPLGDVLPSGPGATLRFAVPRTAPVEIDRAAVPHHLAHAAHAVYTPPFERCVALVIDGAGERSSIDVFSFADDTFLPVSSTSAEHSLGHLYSTVTQLCGFQYWEGEEWKVMGMAAHGHRVPELYRFFHDRTQVDGLQVKLALGLSWIDELRALLRPGRREAGVLQAANLARSFQDYFADTLVALVKNVHALGISDDLAYGGGCALNSAANGRMVRVTGFRRRHVPSAPADDGNALGAALYERHAVRRIPRTPAIASPYLGSTIDLDELERALSFATFDAVRIDDEQELCDRTAAALAQGEIIGWIQGRAEFGPRALGNRSILADPRREDMRDVINRRVKFREQYRPLAPAILHEHGERFFHGYEESPYMERALPFRDEVKALVPTVVHLDGTGRLQSVTRERNPLFHALISAFERQTGIPVLVNTSYNVMGKPISHSAADVLTVFATTGLHAVVVGPWWIRKRA
ncbi:carbamoyltransferase C-terminal domain-containing protein [Hyalangium sp.]|uniref:carbamoyltransferase C-terminal domain-containing protein n=1 Tax=Hyalangium sp. TaxID=2028555 RepID=UPI002D44E280|nr:carbamoyltransferase C-terminal domain-containing protein [Hyalangium sp.]HYH97048.1 carbamoyltransferase C-terminal domain-containing protein [Hyalangium sp.]